jgi:hypothetical protein
MNPEHGDVISQAITGFMSGAGIAAGIYWSAKAKARKAAAQKAAEKKPAPPTTGKHWLD